MFEIGSAEHLELCLLELHGQRTYGFGKIPVAKVQQQMAGVTTAVGYWSDEMKKIHPEVYSFLVGYFGTEDFELPSYEPLTSNGNIRETPRDAIGKFLNIPVKLDA